MYESIVTLSIYGVKSSVPVVDNFVIGSDTSPSLFPLDSYISK